ncbi:MAG: hypothetical protein JWN78_403 [Bacteroidota bacterium]|nr:hypothetical protein [Bacteroidota bacterium]
MNLFLLPLHNGYSYILELPGKYLLVSPYHVFCNSYLERGLLNIDSSTYYRKDIVQNIGCIKGALNSQLDLVAAEIDFYHDTIIKNVIVNSDLQVNNPLPFYFLKIGEYRLLQNIPISFSNHRQLFNELIVCSRISRKGYSGKLVIDNDNILTGMLIADSLTKSYILPISIIFNYLKNSFDFYVSG